MNTERFPVGSRFLVRWVLLTASGYALGFVAGFLLGHAILGNAGVGVGIGAGVGLTQWTLLRGRIPESGRWALVNMLCLGVALAVFALVSFASGYSMDLGWPHGAMGWAVAFLLGGAMIGRLEQGALRRSLGRAEHWPLVCAVGWGLSVLGLAIPPDMTSEMPVALVLVRNGLLAPAAAGIALGVVTGAGLLRFLRQPAPESA